MNRSKLFLMVGVFLVAAFGAVIVHVDAAENDATISLTWDVGDVVDGTISNNVSDYVDPNVPGVTFQLISPPGILGATGSPTTAGTYLGSITNATTGVVEPLSITVRQDAETFTVTFMSGYGGTVSRDSISDVPNNSSITVSNNRVTINGTTVTATANSGYHFSYWYNASGTITANRTITAYFEADTPTEYTCYLRYNANGGSGAPSTQSYTGTSTSSHTFTISSTVPTRNGYTFLGWNTSSTATEAIYHGGDSISVRYNSYVNLYAIWQVTSYTCYLYYDANGGSGAPSTQSYTGTSTSSHTFTISSTVPTRNGYTFLGWSILSTATEPTYLPGGSIEVGYQSTVILFAIWKQILTLNIDLTYLNGHAAVEYNGTVVATTSTFQMYYGDSYTLSITDFATGYHFRYWSFYEPRGQGAYTDSHETYTGTLTTDTYVSPEFNYEVTIRVNNSLMGSVDRSSLIVHDSSIGTSGNVLTIGSNTVTATANTGYEFESWTIPGSVTTVTEPITITANFGMIPTDVTWWSNDQYNGKVDILFKFGDSANKVHTLNMDLYSPTVSEGITTWNPSGFSLTVSVSYPSAQITASLSGGTELSKTINPGKWSTFIVSIDSDNGTVSVTPIKTFESFTNYTVYEKQTKTVLDFSAQIDGAAVYAIGHTESATGENSPRFQVVSTNVFLNTYGVVLYNPTINLFDYWPQYESLRVSFYSFALYGESITINGTTYQVKDGKITIQYVSSGNEHYLPGVMPNAMVQTRTFNLDNIYVTYQDNHAYLTFVPERFTLDLGSYTTGSETISMSGLWYFASMVYEPYTVTEKHLSDWKTFPETSSAQMLLIFIAILIVAGAFVALHIRKSGLGWIDLAIIGCAAVVAFIMLG